MISGQISGKSIKKSPIFVITGYLSTWEASLEISWNWLKKSKNSEKSLARFSVS